MIEKGYDVRMVLASSQDVSYPWDLLRVNSSVLAQQKILREGKIESSVIKGKVSIGKNSIIRPGCCLFGPIRIGKNCEIGPNVVLLPSTSIGDNVTVSPFTQIRNSILMKGASIGPSSIITNSIIADDVEIGCNFISESRVAKVEVENELYSINFGCIIGESSLIGDGTLVKAGRMLGCRCKVGSGCTVSTNLPDNSILN
jgi:glucose-1-phosphate thymidylyltransferase